MNMLALPCAGLPPNMIAGTTEHNVTTRKPSVIMRDNATLPDPPPRVTRAATIAYTMKPSEEAPPTAMGRPAAAAIFTAFL